MPESSDTTEQKVKLSPRELLDNSRFNGYLTPELQEKVCILIAKGTPPRVALRSTGVCDRTVYNWLQWGEEGKDQIYVDLCRAMRQAEANYLVTIAGNTVKHAEKDGRVCVDILGRRDPEHWGKKDTLDVNVEVSADGIFRAIAEAQQKVLTGSYRFLPEGSEEPE